MPLRLAVALLLQLSTQRIASCCLPQIILRLAVTEAPGQTTANEGKRLAIYEGVGAQLYSEITPPIRVPRPTTAAQYTASFSLHIAQDLNQV
jgi:hypothetical protein